MGYHERLRLLYVACTRARDYLVVSVHRATRKNPPADETRMTNAELFAAVAGGAPGAQPFTSSSTTGLPPVPPDVVLPPPSFEAWRARVEPARRDSRRVSAVSASSLEGTLSTDDVDPGLLKGARDLELPPWNKGRYGTALGRAVHGTLQALDLATGAGLAPALAAQCVAEGVVELEDLVLDLCRQALSADILRAAAVRRSWRESYVGTTLDDRTVLEGYIDLVLEEDDGSLVVVDYKTDAVPGPAIPGRVREYLPQMAAYARSLERATGKAVSRAVLLFLAPGSATEVTLSKKSLETVDLAQLTAAPIASDWRGELCEAPSQQPVGSA